MKIIRFNTIKIYLIILLVLSLSYQNCKSNVYKYDEMTETTLVSAVSAFGLLYNLTNTDLQPLSTTQIDNLMKKDLFGFNKFAVDNTNDDVALISDILLGVSLSTAALQIFDGRVSPEWGVYGMMFLESGALAIGSTTIAKNIFREPRPYIYNPDVPLEMKQTLDARQSFFSGHACLSFMAMTFFAETYSNYYPDNSNHQLIWLGSMAVASSTALLRVFSGRHFPIDILVGSVVGFAIGKLIPELHKVENQNQFLITNRTNKIVSVNLQF